MDWEGRRGSENIEISERIAHLDLGIVDVRRDFTHGSITEVIPTDLNDACYIASFAQQNLPQSTYTPAGPVPVENHFVEDLVNNCGDLRDAFMHYADQQGLVVESKTQTLSLPTFPGIDRPEKVKYPFYSATSAKLRR